MLFNLSFLHRKKDRFIPRDEELSMGFNFSYSGWDKDLIHFIFQIGKIDLIHFIFQIDKIFVIDHPDLTISIFILEFIFHDGS